MGGCCSALTGIGRSPYPTINYAGYQAPANGYYTAAGNSYGYPYGYYPACYSWNPYANYAYPSPAYSEPYGAAQYPSYYYPTQGFPNYVSPYGGINYGWTAGRWPY